MRIVFAIVRECKEIAITPPIYCLYSLPVLGYIDFEQKRGSRDRPGSLQQ
jgi:hypothetical protein